MSIRPTSAKFLTGFKNVVHVRGTPTSGKTTISVLLRDCARKNGKTVFRLPKWRRMLKEYSNENPWVNFGEVLKYEYVGAKNVFAEGNILRHPRVE